MHPRLGGRAFFLWAIILLALLLLYVNVVH